jgi:4-coumarate--CoA ligase
MLAFIFSIVQPIFFSSKKIISSQSHSPQFYTEIIEKYGVTHLFGVTPSISEIFTEYIDKTNCQDKLKSLKCLIVGGTTFISKMHKNIQGVLPFVRILNTYSTIEMGKIISITSESGEIFDTVGKVTPNTQVKIVDKFGNCVYTHDRGEILVRCSNNFLGYVGDEKKTKEALTDDGWFRTGDYGYFDYQERLYVFCRMNDLLNINGIKVLSPT